MSPAERLRDLLDSRGETWPGPIEHHEAIGSTSDRAKELERAGAPEWSAVLAERQTAGRGRLGRTWESPAGNLFLSVVLRPRLPPERLTLLPLAAGVAVAEAVDEQGVTAQLKWPNDVLVGSRKLGGILAEGLSGSRGTHAVVLGVGVNVRLDASRLAPETAAGATSLDAETGRPGDVIAVAAAVLARLRARCHDLAAADGAARTADAWRARALPWWGREVVAREGDQVIRGVARDIDARGGLLVETAGGVVRALLSGEVFEVRAP